MGAPVTDAPVSIFLLAVGWKSVVPTELAVVMEKLLRLHCVDLLTMRCFLSILVLTFVGPVVSR